MLAENVGWVFDSINVVEANDLASNGLLYSVEREGIVTLVQLDMGYGGTVNNGVVITEHEGLLSHRDT